MDDSDNKKLPARKNTRLTEYDYSLPGAYFLTICAAGKKPIFGRLVGDGVLDVPQFVASEYGRIVEETIREISSYSHISIDSYVIMPNHVHFILFVNEPLQSGTSRTPSPTEGVTKSKANAVIPAFVSTLKRFTNRKSGVSLWQRSYYDRVLRNEKEYLACRNYIDGNPSRWQEDQYFEKQIKI